MANQKLDERIKVWADKIYGTDQVKFRRLISWIKAAEQTYEVVVIARALEEFVLHVSTVGEDWWAYLDRILDAEEGKHNARNAQAKSEQDKTEIGELAQDLLKGINARRLP